MRVGQTHTVTRLMPINADHWQSMGVITAYEDAQNVEQTLAKLAAGAGGCSFAPSSRPSTPSTTTR